MGLGVVLTFSSCTTITHTSKVADIDTRIYNLTVAELDVKKEKTEATANWNWTPFSTFNLKEAKDNVTADALKSSGGDVLVEPQFEIKRRGFLRGGSISVSGYPATYKNFHNMTAEEAKVLNPSSTVVAPEMYPAMGLAAMKKKKKAAGTPIFSNKKERESHNFFNILGGGSFDFDEDLEGGGNVGVMYGKTGLKFGAYVKAMMLIFGSNYEYEESSDSHMGFTLTAGIVKPFGNWFSLFAGLGVGMYPKYEYDYDYINYTDYSVGNKFTIPVEAGFQISFFGKVNLMCGFNYCTPISGDGGVGSPFVGLGYVF